MLRWMDGFEQYGTDENHMLEGVGGAAAWSEVGQAGFGNGWALSALNPATGASHLRLTNEIQGGTSNLRRAVGQSKQVTGCGYRMYVDDLPAFEEDSVLDAYLCLLEFRDVANARQIRVNLGTEGSVRAMRESTALGRSDPCIAAGGYHHIEVKSKIANTGGYVEVRVNEVTVLNLTGIDTQNTANAETSQISMGQRTDVLDPGVGFGFMDVDDIFLWDDDASDAENTVVDWVGDKGCYYLPVNADTAEADWSKSSGTVGYSLIDELDPSGTDYITTGSPTARSIFGVAGLPGNVSELIALMPVLRARKEESGSVAMRGGVVVGTDESYGPDDSPSTSFAYLRPGPKTIDPSTGVAWATNAEFKLLVERTA